MVDNFSDPWVNLASSKEVYTLRWESKYLLELGEALEYILDTVMTLAAKEALKYTVLAGTVKPLNFARYLILRGVYIREIKSSR